MSHASCAKSLLLIGLLGIFPVACTEEKEQVLTVFAAVSLVDLIEDIGASPNAPLFEIHAAGSELLIRQVHGGAPADLLVVARPLARGELPVPSPRVVPWMTTELVAAWAPHQSRPEFASSSPGALADLAGWRIAVADPGLAPAGVYAERSIRREELWETLSPHLRFSAHVRDACGWALLGETDAVLCYRTDVAALEGLEELFPVPGGLVTYTLAVVAPPSRQEAALKLATYFQGDAVSAIFVAHGFGKPR